MFESLFIELPTSKQNKHIILGNIYKPPKENNNNSNTESFISAVCHEGLATERSGQYGRDRSSEAINVALCIAHRHVSEERWFLQG